MDLDLQRAQDTLRNLHHVWTRPVNILSRVNGKGKMLRFDDHGYSEKSAEYRG
jgi:stage V sporulation protein R